MHGLGEVTSTPGGGGEGDEKRAEGEEKRREERRENRDERKRDERCEVSRMRTERHIDDTAPT